MTREEELKRVARKAGADLAGIADLSPFKSELCGMQLDVIAPFSSALSIAIHLNDDIVDQILDSPTPDYVQHYRDVNARLNDITANISDWITQKGYRVRSIPASETVDKTEQMGAVSHKAIARMAGIGWQGKSLLIVSPQFGPRIRLSSLLTDMPLTADKPLKNRCGTCIKCTQACPGRAIKNTNTKDHYNTRDEALHFNRCVEQTSKFKALPDIGAQVCGVCVRVCPFGKKRPKIV